MIGRIDQQIRVTKLMLSYYDVTKIQNRKLRHYMVRYLEIMMVICSIPRDQVRQRGEYGKEKALWEELKKSIRRSTCASAGILGTGHEPSGKRRKIPLHRGI